MSFFKRILGNDPIKPLEKIADQVEALESSYAKLTDAELRGKTEEFKQRLSQGQTLDDLLPEAFAAVREASVRTTGMKHFRVQVLGGIVLHQGRIAEMKTGEGKTLVASGLRSRPTQQFVRNTTPSCSRREMRRVTIRFGSFISGMP